MDEVNVRKELEDLDPSYFAAMDGWTFWDPPHAHEEKSFEAFLGFLRSPLCKSYSIDDATPHAMTITLHGPKGLAVYHRFCLVPRHIFGETSRWTLYGTLKDYPRVFYGREKLAAAAAALMGIISVSPKD